MKKLFLILLLFLLGVNGVLFWQNTRTEEHAAGPPTKKTAGSASAIMFPVLL